MSDDAGGRVDGARAEPTDGDSKAAEQRAAIRERYGRIARDAGDDAGDDAHSGDYTDDDACGGDRTDDADTGDSCCGDSGDNASGCGDSADNDSCCGEEAAGANGDGYDQALGYSEADVEAVAEGANLQLGCGNPTTLASLRTGETVLDLGSGAGFDCFLAAREVGPEGRVLGVDMTPDMVERARANVRKNDADNVEFRLGEIEHLPIADGSVDVVISNCVVNLSPDKPQVFREAYRVLRPGGRLAISDVVLTAEPPADRAPDPDSVTACVAGASSIPALETMLADAGFEDVSITPKDDSQFIKEWDDDRDLTEFLVSATIEGRKPEASTAR